MARDYLAELTEVRDAIRATIKSGGVVQMRIGVKSYTLSLGKLQELEQELSTKIRIRAGGGRSIVGEAEW